jgi:hypothetical protein
MKKLWIVIGIVVVLGVAVGGVFVYSAKNTKVLAPGETAAATPTPVVGMKTWNDPAGFSFQYPKDLSVNNHEDDNDNYAHVELTNKDHPGNIIVWVSDPPKIWPPKEGTSIDTTLGGIPAKKILISTPSAKLIVGAVSEGLLFKIDGTLTDKPYWQSVEDGIVKTFSFTPNSPTIASGQPAGGESVDEEEVVQ